jgi:hypothetical protein
MRKKNGDKTTRPKKTPARGRGYTGPGLYGAGALIGLDHDHANSAGAIVPHAANA